MDSTSTFSAVATTLAVEVTLPSFVDAVITALPSFNALTTPLESTDAIVAALLFHCNVLSVAFAGSTVAMIVLDDPTVSERSVGFTEIDSTAIVFAVTETFADVEALPSFEEAVIIAVPTFSAFTNPFESTLAMVGALLVHFSVLSVAFAGSTVAEIAFDDPTIKESSVEFNVIDSTETDFAFTVTSIELVTLPSF